jgi:hypothetical protein
MDNVHDARTVTGSYCMMRGHCSQGSYSVIQIVKHLSRHGAAWRSLSSAHRRSTAWSGLA